MGIFSMFSSRDRGGEPSKEESVRAAALAAGAKDGEGAKGVDIEEVDTEEVDTEDAEDTEEIVRPKPPEGGLSEMEEKVVVAEKREGGWLSGLRESVSRFVGRHTRGTVDQREDLSGLEKVGAGTVHFAEGLLGGVASVAGVKLAYDLSLGISQEVFTRRERESLIADIQEKFRGTETMEGGRREGSELAKRYSAIESRIDSSEHLTPAKKRELKAKLASIIDEDDRSRRAAYLERDEKVRSLFEEAIETRLTGMGLAKEALNTAMAATGMTALRGTAMLGFSAVEAYRAASKGLEEESEKGGFAETAKRAFVSSWEAYRADITGKNGYMAIGRGVSKTMRLVGFGSMALEGLADVAEGNMSERIEALLQNANNPTENMAHAVDRATFGLGGRLKDMVAGHSEAPVVEAGGRVSQEDIEAGKDWPEKGDRVNPDMPQLEADIKRMRLADAAAGHSEAPVVEAGGRVSQEDIEAGKDWPEKGDRVNPDMPQLEADIKRLRLADAAAHAEKGASLGAGENVAAISKKAIEVGLVREGDGISQAVARQIDIMPEAEFKTLAAQYGFAGERTFDASDAAHDHIRTGDYKKFVARLTREIVKNQQAYAVEHGLPQEGFSEKAIGQISAVLVPDGVSKTGFHIEYLNKDGSPLELDESKYNLEGSWDKGAHGGATGGIENVIPETRSATRGATVEVATAMGAGELPATGKIVEETVYKVGEKTVTFEGGKVLLDGVEMDIANLGTLPEGDQIRNVIDARSDILDVTDRLQTAARAGNVEEASKLLAELKRLERENGTWGIVIDIPDDALEGLKTEYHLTDIAPTESSGEGVKKIVKMTVEREANARPAEIAFTHDTKGAVTGIDITDFRVTGKDLVVAREMAKEALGIDVENAATRVRVVAPDIKRYYVLSKALDSLEESGKGGSSESNWVRGQLDAIYRKYNPEEDAP